MASEVSELASIKDEDLLRRMWQQTEDFCRKKEIRAHMYKLREERLRNFYTGDMDAGIGMSKSPMIPSHGDSLADQSFQSLKAKEIRDCASPTRHVQYDLATPDTSGWNVISTSQLSSDGKEQQNITLATTDAVQDIQGGKATFSGKNELIESHRHDGDDKNYTSTSGHASNTILKEHVVTGDAKNGRTESISNTTSSTSKTITSSKYQSDNSTNDDFVQEFEGVLNSARRSVRENTNQSNSNNDQFERIPCNDFEKEYLTSKTTNQSSSTTSNQQSTYEIRRNSASSTTSSADARKIQRETEYFANAPGQLISRTVEYPDANTKVITETKTLADGSTVTTTKYESRAASSTNTSKSSKQEKSSTSRTVTEDRAERNRIEIIAGGNKNVIDEVVKSKRIVDADDVAGVKPDSNESFKKKSVKTEFYRNENGHQDNTQKETLNQEFIHKDSANEHQRNVRHEEIRVHKPVQSETVHKETAELYESTNDRFQKQNNEKVTSHMEIIVESDQQRKSVSKQNVPVQGINTENKYDKQSTETHKTVKKDLSRDHERYTKERPIESDLPDEHYDRPPVVEEPIVPKKEVYHICSPSHDHSPKPATKTTSKPDYTSKRISVDHNPTHEAFARSLRCVTPDIDKRSSTTSVKTSYTYTDRDHRSPSRDTNVSDTSKFSSTTVTKSYSPNRKLSPEKRKTTISSETIDITSSEQLRNEKKTESRKGSQTFTSSKNIPKSEDHYDHPRNNQPVYDIPTNNTPVRKNSSDQPSYCRPTASSTRHNNVKPDEGVQKPKKRDNDEPIYETVVDKPSSDRRHSSKIDSKTTVTTSVVRETNDYRNVDRPTKKHSTGHQPEYESNFDSGRSISPTSSVSDIEYVNFKNTNRTVTDLDEIEIVINTKDKTTVNRDTQDGLFLSTHKKKSSSPTLESDTDTIVEQETDQEKEPFYLNDEKQKDVKETRRQKPPLTRSETYEERCRSMLGMKVESEERETVKNSKQASYDLISSERRVENRSPSKSPSKSPDRKNSTNAGHVDRSPSRSPERKPSSAKPNVVEDDGRFDTFTRAKSNKSSSPKRTPLQTEEKVPMDTSTFDRKSQRVTNDHTTSPVRSNTSSPDRKKPSEVTKQFMKEEIRSSSFTTKSTKTKDTQNESVTTRETSPKREPKSEPIKTSTSPKRSPNRSPNTSPSRNRPKESVVETTKKLLNSESVSRKTYKPEFGSTTATRVEERDTHTKDNKVNKVSRKSPTRVDRTSPTRTTTDETFTETTETFFSETKADTIKRRPSSENRNSVGKSNGTSPDRKLTNKEVHRKPLSEENKASTPKKPTHISVSTDSQDVSRATTNTFTRKKTSETIETTSPTKPKGKPVDNSIRSTSPAKSTAAPSKVKAKPAKIDIKAKPKPKQTNNYSTDEDSDDESASKKSPKRIPITERKDSAPVYRSTKVDKEVKMARSTSEHFSATSRKGSKPDIETPKSPQKFEKRPTKCMTTKTINLSTAKTINSEDMENVIIDIQLAKSSREPTPNRIIPTPVSPEEDTGKIPRYPDTVHEPDDERPQRRPNIKNIPIFEENTKEYISCHITEVSEDYGASDNDECMLSVSDKVTKFSAQVTSPTNEKAKRNMVETVNEFSEDVDDESRLSVQGKVSRFTAIAEEVNTTKTSSTKKEEYNTSAKVNEKVTQFTEKEVRNSKPFKPEPVRNTDRVKTRRDFEDIDETLKNDECLLSVSDKVNKFVATAETLTASVPHMSDVKSPELVAKVQRQVSLRDTVLKPENHPRTPSDQYDSGTEKPTSKGKITDRYVPNKSKPTSSPSVPISLSSIDVVKKAKSIFEKGDTPKAPKQRDILTRPSIWEQRRAEAAKNEVKLTDIGVFKKEDSPSEMDSRPSSRSPETRQSSCSPEPRKSSRSPEQRRPSYVYERSSSPVNTRRPHVDDSEPKKQQQKIQTAKKTVPTNDQTTSKKPKTIDAPDTATDKRSYMNHTIASLEHIRRDSIEINKTNIRKSALDDEVDQVESNPKSSVKFGVELKRTNSQQSTGRRKSSCSEIPHVEEIFDLELLERMLDTVVGYEQRRRIRAQIRLVKKQIQDEEKAKGGKKTTVTNRTEVTTESWRRKPEPSPTRSPLRKKNEDVSEYTSKFSKTSKVERTTSPVRKTSPQRRHNENVEFISSERTAIEEDVSVRRSSPNRKSSIDGNSNDYRSEQVNSYVQISRSPSPKSNKISSNLRNAEVKQVNASKSNDDDKPIWARKNILTKASDSTRTFASSGKKTTTVTKVQKQKTVEQNDDCVTSSYGIGPTDEDGKPLFGIRALKKKSPTVQTSKVSGTIVHETLFSDNGAPPTGNRTTTMYSSDPQDVRHFVESNGTASDIRNRLIERENNRRGITTVTTSQTITAIDSPEDLSTSNSRQPKVVRRGSVKELSEKFQKESTKSSDKTTSSSYPKAGLILRTQTSRESTPGANSSLRSGSADFDDCDIEVRCSSSSRLQSDDEMEFKTTTTSRHQSSSFLNSNRKVTNVQDVLTRMRNADNVVEDGDTEEDKEARALLNKFLGASVLMSGMESMVPREITTIVGAPTSQKQITTTHVTKTVKSTSSPSTTRELKTRDIDSIWDEELLKQLLDQSSSYEERRKIRARLRQVMAEKEESKVQVKSDESSKTVTTTQSITNARTVATTKAVPAKPISPFAKFRQLDKQVSTQSSPNSPNSPSTPKSPGGAPLFKFTDPVLSARAATVKDILLQWCQSKTKEYENVQITNFSTAWSDGLAFCALCHHFLPDSFDYSVLTPKQRRHNFTLAFRIMDEKAGIAPLLDVEDMVIMKKPDWKCVFTYVQSIHRRFRNVE